MKSNLLAIFKNELESPDLSAHDAYKSHANWSSLRALLVAASIEEHFAYLPRHEDFAASPTIDDLWRRIRPFIKRPSVKKQTPKSKAQTPH